MFYNLYFFNTKLLWNLSCLETQNKARIWLQLWASRQNWLDVMAPDTDPKHFVLTYPAPNSSFNCFYLNLRTKVSNLLINNLSTKDMDFPKTQGSIPYLFKHAQLINRSCKYSSLWFDLHLSDQTISTTVNFYNLQLYPKANSSLALFDPVPVQYHQQQNFVSVETIFVSFARLASIFFSKKYLPNTALVSHLFWQELSTLRNNPGGNSGSERKTSKWFGVIASASIGSLDTFVKGRPFKIASTSHISVAKPSSVTICSFNKPFRTLRIERMVLSHIPPIWDAAGGVEFLIHWIL